MTKYRQGPHMDCCNARREALDFKLWNISVWVLLILQVAAAQEGFISIDCGSNSSYTDRRGIEWSTDEGYIATGTNIKVTVPQSLVDFGQQHVQLSNARYFQSSRKRHCYVFPNVTYNATYLIRPSFLYGDLAASVPSDFSFSLAIDSSVVEEIQSSEIEEDTLVSHEYYVVSRSEEIVFCLLPNKGAPFLSSLELRPIARESFPDYMYSDQYGLLAQRLNCGANDTNPSIRYPDDKFDRVWETPGSTYSIPGVWADRTLQNARNGSYDNNFFAPPPVMASAWSNKSIQFSVPILGGRSLWMSFQLGEVDLLSENEQRVQDIYMDGDRWSENFTFPHDSTPVAIFGSGGTPSTSATKLNFVIQRYPNTTLPPVLNGFEIHMILPADTTVIDPSDRQVLDIVRQSLNLMDWTGDPCFPVSWDWLTCSSDDPAMVTQIKLSNYQLNGTIPEQITELPALQDLWLDGNFLRGSIPNLSGLKELQTLHLQNNTLTGTIPATLADIPNLRELYLRDNNFSGAVPTALTQKSGLNLQVDNSTSPGPTPGPSPSAPAPGSKSGSKGTSIGVILGAIVGGVAAIVVLLGALIYCLRKRRKNVGSQEEKRSLHRRGNQAVFPTEKSGGNDHGIQPTKPFSFAEVEKITNNFEEQIGEGGFGPVFFGKLDDGTKVAVKVNSENSGQGSNEFLTEVRLLSRIHHRNLVHLVGFCDENNKRVLLYEFMEEGTLKDHLYGAGQTYAVDWPTRLQIIIDAARGLEYLHYDCHPRIVHRDVKSSNILLNGTLQAKVADFGISKFYEEGMTLSSNTEKTSSAVKGTFGYLDPAYFSTRKLSYKSDVYSFGVIMLEIMSGRAPVDLKLADEEQWSLIDYSRRMIFESKLEMVVDKSLGSGYNKEAMWKVAELAMRCVEPKPINRPDMREVVHELCEASQYGNWMDIPGFGTGSITHTATQNFPPNFSPAAPQNGFSNHRSHQRSKSSTASADMYSGTDVDIHENTETNTGILTPR